MLFLFSILSLVVNATAGERYEFFNGARQMAMGGAVIAVVNDETALISNPAGMGKLRQNYVTLIDPEIHLNQNITRFATASNITGTLSLQGLLDTLNHHPDKHYHLQANLFPSLIIPNFGFGVLANWTYNAEVVSATNTFNLRYRNDYAAIVGYNFRLFDGILKIGFNAKYINRAEADEALPSSSTGLTLDSVVTEGNGIASDAGLIFTLPYTYLPTLAVVVHDVGHTKFDAGGGMFYDTPSRPELVPQTYDAAFSLSPILANRTRLQITGEYRDVLNAYNEQDIFRRIHAGVEFNFSDMIFVRGGYNQKYWTAGFEFAMNSFQFQVASYGEEIGTDNVNNREDRRYIMKFSVRF